MSKDEVYSEEVMEKIRDDAERTLEQIISSDDYELVFSESDGWSIQASDESDVEFL